MDTLFYCISCEHELDISQMYFDIGQLPICIECVDKNKLSEDCVQCNRTISFTQLGYLIEEHKIYDICIKCLSYNDNFIKDNYLKYLHSLKLKNYEDLDFYIHEVEDDNIYYKYKYEEILIENKKLKQALYDIINK